MTLSLTTRNMAHTQQAQRTPAVARPANRRGGRFPLGLMGVVFGGLLISASAMLAAPAHADDHRKHPRYSDGARADWHESRHESRRGDRRAERSDWHDRDYRRDQSRGHDRDQNRDKGWDRGWDRPSSSVSIRIVSPPRVYHPPAYGRTLYSQPVYSQPVYAQPVYSQPTWHQSHYGAPVGRNCRQVFRTVWEYGRPIRLEETLCFDPHGRSFIVAGSTRRCD